MTCKRCTKEEKRQRYECPMYQIDKGFWFTALASFVPKTWGCSSLSARRVVSYTHAERMAVRFVSKKFDQRDLCLRASFV